MNLKRTVRREDGAALLIALALLALFSVLGVAFMRSMSTTDERVDLDMRSVAARHMASGGVQAAIGELQAAIQAKQVPELLAKPLEFDLPVYAISRQASTGFSQPDTRRGKARVTIQEESGKINLNHAPPSVLQAVPGIGGDVARAICNSLPREGAGANGTRWFASLEDLVARGLMPPAAFNALDKRLVTVYTVADHKNPVGFLNVNAAPPEVLAAILNVTPDAAKAVAAKRPFNSLAELIAATGKDPATFNLKPGEGAPGALPRELAFQSHCFRIVSEGIVSNVGPQGQEYRATRSRAEAVVILNDSMPPKVTFWSEIAGRSENEAA